MEKFNQQKYIQNYNKEHYKEFRAYLKQEEMIELQKLLKKMNLSKSDFLRNAIQKLKEPKWGSFIV